MQLKDFKEQNMTTKQLINDLKNIKEELYSVKNNVRALMHDALEHKELDIYKRLKVLDAKLNNILK